MISDHFFARTAELMDRHHRLTFTRDENGIPPLAGPRDNARLEFAHRLRQLSALYDRIELLNEYATVSMLPKGHYRRDRWKGGIPAPFSVWMPHTEELTMWVDAFYLIAWRALEIANQKNPKTFSALPKVEAVGIRDVRNRLIQHPESGALARAWAFSPDDGPMVKPPECRPGSDVPSDRGLFVNAQEFRDALNGAFEVAIAKIEHSAQALRPAV